MRHVRAGFRVGIGPFCVYVPVKVGVLGAVAVVLLGGLVRCAHAGSPTSAPTFFGCLVVSAGTCQDGGGGKVGGFYGLEHIAGAGGSVYMCTTLSGSGMCSGSPALTAWSAITPGQWLLRDRLYVGRPDGTLFASMPSTGTIYDSAAYAAGGQWVIENAGTLEVLWCMAGLLLVVIFAVAWTRSGT